MTPAEKTQNQIQISGKIDKGDIFGPLHEGPWSNFFTLKSEDLGQDFKHKTCLLSLTCGNIKVTDEPAEFVRVKDKRPLAQQQSRTLEAASTIYVHWTPPEILANQNLRGAEVVLHSISNGPKDSILANAKIM